MIRWVLTTMIMGLFAFSLFGEEEKVQTEEKEKKETASAEKKTGAENEKSDPRQTMKRRWTKKTKPGTPKARKVSPGRSRIQASTDDTIGDGMIGLDEEEFAEEDLPVDEGKSG